jgi:hypothetical protein
MMDMEEAKMIFPEYADKFSDLVVDTSKGDDPETKGKAEIYLVQYKKIKQYNVVEVSYDKNIEGQVAKQAKLVSTEELDDMTKQYEDEQGNIQDEAMNEITQSAPMEIEKEEWFQFYMSKQLACILSAPEHIGDIDHYSVMLGYLVSSSIYPVSIVYLTAHLVNAKTIALTKAMYDVIANGNKITVLEEDAIQNITDFKNNINSLTPYAVISKKYLKECREQGIQPDPIKFIDRRVDAGLNVALSEMIDKYIEEMNSSGNTARGIPDYAGQSGVATSQLQSAAMILTKTEELAYSDFIKKLGEILLRDVVDFMDYEFTIPYINNSTQTINPDNVVVWDYENYYVVPIIQNDPEAVEQLMKNFYQQWGDKGWLQPTDVMEKMGEGDAENLYKKSPHYNNIGVIQEAMQDPRIADGIMQLIAGNPNEQSMTAQENKPAVKTK